MTGSDDYNEWVETNPLRAYRKEHKMTLMETASRLGVSMTMIQLWEKGVHVPNERNMNKLVRLCGPGTAQQWLQWFNHNPSLV